MGQFADLKTLLSTDPGAAVPLFDTIVRESFPRDSEKDEAVVKESCQLMADFLRHSSVYKRKLIYSQLQKASLLSRMLLSFQFHSLKDTAFPRRLIFKGRSVFEGNLGQETHRRHHVIAVGSNRFFNLGVISDGSPIEEPHLVSVPHVCRIEMSNSHTVFLTTDNRLFGCGKAASFLPQDVEETESGYVALPTIVQIPNVPSGSRIDDIRVIEGGTHVQIGKEWFFVGKCPFSGSKRIARNCVSISPENQLVQPVRHQVARISFAGGSVEILISLIDGILCWDRHADFKAKKEIRLIAHGFPVSSRFECFQVLHDGTVYVAKNVLLKGKLQFWKNVDDGFQVINGTEMEHLDTKNTLVALLEEVPGSIGTNFFRLSPDGQNLIIKLGYQSEDGKHLKDGGRLKFQSLSAHLILKKREEEECDPVDFPVDMTLCFHKNLTGMTTLPTNRLIFEAMFPDLVPLINQDGEFHIRHVPESEQNVTATDVDYPFKLDLESPRELPSPKDPAMEFVPDGTDPSLIWHLITTGGTKVPCHKYFLLLHSRQIGALQRFNRMPVYGRIEEDESEETTQIDANAKEETVRNALRGMFNPIALFSLKTVELVECIHFYDYHLMFELFHDAFFVFMETITDFSLPFLFELFNSFEEKVLEGVLERPHLLFNSVSPNLPSNTFLLKFALAHKERRSSSDGCTETLQNFEADDLARYFIDLDLDSEEAVWKSIRTEFGTVLDSSMAEASRRKEEKRTIRTRTSSHTHRQDVSSVSTLPIPIRRKNVSFSESAGSPTLHSPAATSMPTKTIPIERIRTESISNSLEDFPEISGSPSALSSTSTPNKSKRFAPKGARFKNANEILLSPERVNPWKTPIQEDAKPSNMNEIFEKEEKLQRNIKTGFKKVESLRHVEAEELAQAEIRRLYDAEFAGKEGEVIIRVEVLGAEQSEVGEIVWGSMPGLIRR